MLSRMRWLCCLVLLWAVPAVAWPAEDLKLGMSAAFSGPSQGLGIELYRGAMAYFEQVNRRGGVGGRRISLIAYDDGYNPTPAIENTIRLIEVDRVLCLFSFVGTPTVTRILPLVKSYGARDIHLFFPFTGAQPQREPPYDRFVFNLRASYRQETRGLVDRLVQVGRKRIAVLYQADAYGRSGWDGVRRALEARGLSIAAEATYRRGSGFGESMQAQVEIIRRAAPDAVICVGYYAACAAFIREARDSGLSVPIANLSFVGSESMLALLEDLSRERGRDYTRDLINSQVVPSYEDTSLPAVREYRALMDEIWPAPPPGAAENYAPLRYSFVGFEGFLNAKTMVRILSDFVKNGREADNSPSAAAEGIRELDLGLGQPVRFSADRHQGLDAVYFTTVERGKFMPLADFERWRK
jgi:ABC-type branched-subunit amino acid transport system substrate-binding protein